MKKDNFAKKVWISFGVILGSVIIASAALYYFSNDLAAQANKITTDREAVNQQNNSLNDLASLESEQSQAQIYTDEMNKFLPDQYSIVNFNSWVIKAGLSYGVQVSSAFVGNGSPATQATPSTPGTILFSLSVQGTPGSTVKFLNYIESNATGYVLTLGTLDYTSDGSTEKVTAQGTLFFK